VAMTDYWRTFNRDGKISPGWCEWGTIMYKVAVYAPAEKADTLPVFHLHPYMYSMVLI
jgi:hypothetical protein